MAQVEAKEVGEKSAEVKGNPMQYILPYKDIIENLKKEMKKNKRQPERRHALILNQNDYSLADAYSLGGKEGKYRLKSGDIRQLERYLKKNRSDSI